LVGEVLAWCRLTQERDGVMAAGEQVTGSDVVMYWPEAQRVGRSAYEFVTTKYLSGMMHAASRAGIELVIAKSLSLAYACVDFLEAAGGLWLSEAGADGAATTDAELNVARFTAHRRQFDRHVSAIREPGSRLRLTP
jgi:hypothetical protein